MIKCAVKKKEVPENMERSPYKKDYFEKQKRSRNALFIVGAVLLVWLSIMIVMSLNNNSGETGISSKLKPTNTPPVQKNMPEREDAFPDDESEYYSEDEDDEELAQIREEIAKVTEDIQKKIARDNPSGEESDTEEVQEQPTAVENPAENKKKETKKDKIIDKRRYYLTALYDMAGGADIAVTDAYTSEIRLLENVTGKTKIVLFKEQDTPAGSLRYASLIYHNSGKIEGAVLDEYTGELKKITGLSNNNPVKTFKENEGSDYLRYSVSKEFILGDIVLYFTDTYTSEVRSTAVKSLPDSINIFKRNRGQGSRRYFSWVDYIGTSTHNFCIDTYTSEIREKTDLKVGEPVTFFTNGQDQGDLRYEGWTNWPEDGTIKIYALDTYTSEIRVLSTPSMEETVTLFENHSNNGENKGPYRRYTGGVGYITGRGIISFVMDTFTGEMRIKTGNPENYEKPIQYFKDTLKPGVCRYLPNIFYQLAGGVDVYVIDTFTGEIRVKTHVVGEQSLNLFR